MRTISLLTAMLMTAAAADAARLKEVVSLEGVRDNQLVGYGLVVGLNGTGDKRQTVFSAQTLTNLLARMGVTVNPTAILVRNTAAVLVTADLPPFAQPGTRIDVTVSAIGDATNLQGGMLVLTPLKAANGEVFAVSQGSVVTGGFGAGRGGNSQTVNHPTAGRIPSGAIVEKPAPSVEPKDVLRLQLRQADFTTAARVVAAINGHFNKEAAPPATAENSGIVVVKTPAAYRSRVVELIAELEALPIDADHPPKIVMNERTGTLVMGNAVKIGPVSILHGALTVEVQTTYAVSQPEGFSQGTTAAVPQTSVTAKEDKAHGITLKQGATVEDLMKALSAIGSTPRDVIAILQSLKAAGALEAEIEVI